MPELPEVETIVRDLRSFIMGRVVSGLIIREKALTHSIQTEANCFFQGIMGQSVVTVLRRGKYIILPLSNTNVLVFHLGMTGKLLIKESPDVSFDELLTGDTYVDKHTHILVELLDPSGESENLDLHFNDVRLFGNVWLVEDVQNIEELDVPGLKELGPDALGISLKEFEGIMCTKRAVKAVLLDQSKIAGVGNIYADETCFAAEIHPATRGSSLTEEQVAKLWFSVKSVLKQGIKYRGSSTSDYTTIDGSKGSFQLYHRVYGKTGQECVECGTIIERIKLAGRSTHYCPTCQPKKGTE
jgi:formamidopyrimidine-DNA glycosylase